MSYKVDFHIHSYYSDGVMKPTDLVRMYKERDYDIISITDHDGVDGIKEAVIAGEALQIKVVPGVELATAYEIPESGANGDDCRARPAQVELHLLGYEIDIENEAFLSRLAEIRKGREDRNTRLLKHLNELGYELSFEDLLERPGQTYVGKPNFARALKRKGYEIDNPWEIFGHVDREKISAYEGIELIKSAGGIAVLAHPMKTKGLGEIRSDDFWEAIDKLVRDLKKNGLKGLECYHPSATDEDSLRLVGLAEKYHLHITEGSDFHSET